MLIPFPAPPAIRKVPDHIFPHLAAAVDPPEVVVDLRWMFAPRRLARTRGKGKKSDGDFDDKLMLARDKVKVLREEAVGMYEIAVLEAGSAAALKTMARSSTSYKLPRRDGQARANDYVANSAGALWRSKRRSAPKSGVDPASRAARM